MNHSAHDLLAAAGEKLHTPILPTRVHISARVTVFFASAGFGKTYAMADACERLRGEGASAVWLSCAALALTAGDVQHGIGQFFDIFGDAETVFLDDLEALSSEQRKALLQAFVLTEPKRKIVLATRSLDDLGLARLLAGGAVQLIEADMLRWRQRQLSQLWRSRLTAKQINFVDGIAQGWPAVSQLLARAICQGGDFLADTVLMNASLVTDYIRTETLATFESSLLPLLAMTSLVDAFDDALIHRLAERSTLTCDELVRRLPGLCTYQDRGARIAYNHALRLHLQQVFATLQEQTRSQALRQAADWAAANGSIVSAVKLAARAEDRQRIIDYVTQAGGLRIQAAKGHDDLRAVVAAAGDTLVAEEPRLKLMKCVVLLKDGQVREAARLYQEVAAVLPADGDSERGVAFVRVSLGVYGCQLSSTSDAEVDLAARSLDQDPAYRTIAPTILAIMHSQRADFAAANAALSVARAHARHAGVTYNLMFLDFHSVVVALACGNVEDARAYLTKARQRWRSEFPNDQAAETVMLCLGAQLAFERGNLSQAKQLIGQLGDRLAHSEAWLDIYFAGYEPTFRLLAREQGLSGALAAVDRSARQLKSAGLDRVAAGLRNIGACLIGEAFLQGSSVAAPSFQEGASDVGVESWQEKELRQLASGYGKIANERPSESRRELDSLIEFAEQHGLQRTKLRALLLRQVAKDLEGDDDSATEDFWAALEIGARTGMRQAFLEFGVDRVKARLAAGTPGQFSDFAASLGSLIAASQPGQPKDTLTRREAQVLELLTSGGSDKDLGRQLQVTEYAVRFHLKNIYRKLGVHDRSAAISHFQSWSAPRRGRLNPTKRKV